MTKTLNVQDIYANQFLKQFTEIPANLIQPATSKYFDPKDVVLLITEIEAAGAYTITFKDESNQVPTRGGTGNTQYFLPILVKELVSVTGITRISGYYCKTKTFN